MAKTRKLKSMEQRIYLEAKRAVRQSVSSDRADKAYDKIADLVASAMVEKFPSRDMRVLKKYGVSRLDTCIRLVNDSGGVEIFWFRDGDKRVPTVPKRGCSSRGLLMTQDMAAALSAYTAEKDSLEKKIGEVLEDYRALISGARYLEDILEAWPASASVVQPMMNRKSTALTAISPDLLKRIKASNVSTQEAAE